MRLFFCDCEASWTNWTCWHYRCDICSSQRIIGEDADWTVNSGLEGAYHLCCKCSQRQVVSDERDTIKHCEILFCAMANGMLWEHDIKYLTMSYWRRQQVRHALNYRFVTYNDEKKMLRRWKCAIYQIYKRLMFFQYRFGGGTLSVCSWLSLRNGRWRSRQKCTCHARREAEANRGFLGYWFFWNCVPAQIEECTVGVCDGEFYQSCSWKENGGCYQSCLSRGSWVEYQ